MSAAAVASTSSKHKSGEDVSISKTVTVENGSAGTNSLISKEGSLRSTDPPFESEKSAASAAILGNEAVTQLESTCEHHLAKETDPQHPLPRKTRIDAEMASAVADNHLNRDSCSMGVASDHASQSIVRASNAVNSASLSGASSNSSRNSTPVVFLEGQPGEGTAHSILHDPKQKQLHHPQQQQKIHDGLPLPHDLVRILQEVATTGVSTLLPWYEDGNQMSGDSNSCALIPAFSGSFYDPSPQPAFPPSHRPSQAASSAQGTSGSGTAAQSRYLYRPIAISHNKRARTSRSRKNRGSKSKMHRYLYGGGGSTTTTTTTGAISVGGAHAAATVAGQQAANASATATRIQYLNGLHPRRSYGGTGSGSRKRPLVLIRTSGSAPGAPSGMFSPGSVGSGRTSGSEPEDLSQYECDSEGTSATSNSELSFEQGRGGANENSSFRKRRGLALQQGVLERSVQSIAAENNPGEPKYKCLQDAFRIALELVLDFFFRNCGGYTLSPAEKLRNAQFTTSSDASTLVTLESRTVSQYQERKKTHAEFSGDKVSGTKMSAREKMMNEGLLAMNGSENASVASEKSNENKPMLQQELIFRERRKRLLDMLGSSSRTDANIKSNGMPLSHLPGDNGPPFTIQRLAEVLIAPERYYSRTHKLCNCLEKLLLVTLPTTAFGGSTGGDTSQSRREETELAALADEMGRVQTEFRQNQRRLRKKAESPLSDDAGISYATKGHGMHDVLSRRNSGSGMKLSSNAGGGGLGSEDNHTGDGTASEDDSREMLEAAARASLRTKFDHVGIDPHSSAAVNNREARSIAENRGMTNSPPPPSLSIAGSPGMSLPGAHSGLLRQHSHGSPSSPTSPKVRAPSPILFNNSGESSSPPMAPLRNPVNLHLYQMQHSASVGGMSSFELMALNASDNSGVGSSASGSVHGLTAKEMDLESRSSASSDVDSESDVSFDDSASDRSDGSDSGQHYEPLTAARAMALNRMQQQQRLQSRVLTSLQQHGSSPSEGFRPPADSEYQSGDSIDSTRAEDSGGSDSSSSDIAD
jgi:PPP4R2